MKPDALLKCSLESIVSGTSTAGSALLVGAKFWPLPEFASLVHAECETVHLFLDFFLFDCGNEQEHNNSVKGSRLKPSGAQ